MLLKLYEGTRGLASVPQLRPLGPVSLFNIDGGSQMRRRIEVFQGFVNTYFFLLDSLFSSLPLPPAARGALFEKTAPLDPLQKLLIKTTDYTDYFNFFLSVISVAKK
jgi:hypothetical protein